MNRQKTSKFPQWVCWLALAASGTIAAAAAHSISMYDLVVLEGRDRGGSMTAFFIVGAVLGEVCTKSFYGFHGGGIVALLFGLIPFGVFYSFWFTQLSRPFFLYLFL